MGQKESVIDTTLDDVTDEAVPGTVKELETFPESIERVTREMFLDVAQANDVVAQISKVKFILEIRLTKFLTSFLMTHFLTLPLLVR
jgi:hypothetical protein